MRTIMTTWLVLAFICCGLTAGRRRRCFARAERRRQGKSFRAPRTAFACATRPTAAGGPRFRPPATSICRARTAASGGSRLCAAGDSDERPSTETTKAGEALADGPSPQRASHSVRLAHGDESGLFAPPIEDVSGDGIADPWANKNNGGWHWQPAGTDRQPRPAILPAALRRGQPYQPRRNQIRQKARPPQRKTTPAPCGSWPHSSRGASGCSRWPRCCSPYYWQRGRLVRAMAGGRGPPVAPGGGSTCGRRNP